MSKRNLTNLILLLFILILVALVVFEPGKKIAEIPTTLTTIKPNDIHHIKINRQAKTSTESNMEFKKTNSGWAMVKPYQLAANTFRINSILELLSTPSFSQNDLSKLNLNTFGLDKPRATITFNESTTVIFGHNKSLKNHRYIQIDKTLHMIADTFFYQLAAKAESYVSHKLLPEGARITQLILPGLNILKLNAKWNLTPKTSNISTDSINKLIDEWQLSQAYDINKIKATPNSETDILIQLDNNTKLFFKIEKHKDSFNLINIKSGIRYILSKDSKDKLLKLPSIKEDY